MHYSLFTFNKLTNCFVTELSQFPDVLLQSFKIIGKKHEVEFQFEEALRDYEGEIIAWLFKGKHNGVEYSAHIMND